MEVWLILGAVESTPFLKERVNPFTVVPICTGDMWPSEVWEAMSHSHSVKSRCIQQDEVQHVWYHAWSFSPRDASRRWIIIRFVWHKQDPQEGCSTQTQNTEISGMLNKALDGCVNEDSTRFRILTCTNPTLVHTLQQFFCILQLAHF